VPAVALPAGVVVLDFDPRNGGAPGDLGLDPEAADVRTAGGGWHFYRAGDLRMRNGILPGVDVKAEGGYVVAPGAVLPDGRTYEGALPARGSLPPLEEAARAAHGARRAATPAAGAEPAQLGTRDDILAWLGHLRRDGSTEAEMLGALRASDRLVSLDDADPWDDKDLVKLASEAARWEPAEDIGDWCPTVIAVHREPAEATGVPAARLRHQLGGDAILDLPEHVEAVWGTGGQVLWARGEALWIAGGIGTGKTTIAGQVVLHGIGVRAGPFLGHPLALPDGVVGYVAADRPSQILRSFRRMISEADRDAVNDRLDIWRGALPFALDSAKTGELADFVGARGWSTLVLDSLKDLCTGTTDDEAGLRINAQLQECLVRGVEVLVLHHQRKATEGNRRPKKLDDVYGSRWLTAGAGSVLSLWGEPGGATVEMTHLKQPVEDAGPLALAHDHATGTTTAEGAITIAAVAGSAAEQIRAALPGTVAQVADRTGLSERTVADRLREMGRAGLAGSLPHAGNEPATWEASGE